MQALRKSVFWIHLIVGLTVGLAIAWMAATGSILAFEHPVITWAERVDPRLCAPPAGIKVTDKNKAWLISSLIREAMKVGRDVSPTAVICDPDLGHPLAVQFGREQVVYLNNFTGEIVGFGAPRLRSFFATVQRLHTSFALAADWRRWGQAVSGAAALGLGFLVLSGLWLWIPWTLRWSSFRQRLLINFRWRGKARDWNWHHVIGIWMAVPLLAISLTGIIMAYPWANALLFRAMGESPPVTRENARTTTPRTGGQRNGRNANRRQQINLDGVDDMWSAAEFHARPGWTTMSMRLGGGGGGSEGEGADGRGGTSFIFNYGTSRPEVPLGRVTMTINRDTGDLLSTDTFATVSPGRRARSLIVPAHRGEIFGLPGMIGVFISAIGALVMVYTGFALAWRRLVRPMFKRTKTPATIDGAVELTHSLTAD